VFGITYPFRVSQAEEGTRSACDDREEKKKQRALRMERINNKIHAFLWCVGAAMTIYYTDFFRVLLENENVDRCERFGPRIGFVSCSGGVSA
jgi:hypothetical protein